MNKFNVGDRVIHPLRGEGEIICYEGVFPGVRFDVPFASGHDLNGRCPEGYGWFYFDDDLDWAHGQNNDLPEIKFTFDDLIEGQEATV